MSLGFEFSNLSSRPGFSSHRLCDQWQITYLSGLEFSHPSGWSRGFLRSLPIVEIKKFCKHHPLSLQRRIDLVQDLLPFAFLVQCPVHSQGLPSLHVPGAAQWQNLCRGALKSKWALEAFLRAVLCVCHYLTASIHHDKCSAELWCWEGSSVPTTSLF